MKNSYPVALCVVMTIMAVAWISSELRTRYNMAAAHAHFVQAVRIAKRTLQSPNPAIRAQAPRSTGEWISEYHGYMRNAPAGGPAFVVNSEGDLHTGAIGVSATAYGAQLQITRPAYGHLQPLQIIVAAQAPQA